MKIYTKKIEFRLKELKKSKKWLSEQLGISNTNLPKLVRGETNFGIKTLIQLCESLEVDPNYFFMPSPYQERDNSSLVSEGAPLYFTVPDALKKRVAFLEKENKLLRDQIELYRSGGKTVK